MAQKFGKDKDEKIINMYLNKMSSGKIAKEMNISPSSVINVLKRNGIESRSNKENSRKFTLNEDYFEIIDIAEKAYWLGFMYADGYINKDNNFGMSLSIKDISHLEKFKKDINSTYEIKQYISSGYSNSLYVRLLMKSEKSINDLIDKGCYKNKTNILTKPKNIPNEYIKDFIRGYFDGDGCFTYSIDNVKTEHYRSSVKILGTEDFLNFIKVFIEKNTSIKIGNYYTRKEGQIVKSLEFGGNLQVQEFMNLLYKDANIFLERKNTKYLYFLSLINK